MRWFSYKYNYYTIRIDLSRPQAAQADVSEGEKGPVFHMRTAGGGCDPGSSGTRANNGPFPQFPKRLPRWAFPRAGKGPLSVYKSLRTGRDRAAKNRSFLVSRAISRASSQAARREFFISRLLPRSPGEACPVRLAKRSRAADATPASRA